MTNINRRAALIGAAVSTIALSGAIGAPLAGKRPRPVSSATAELQAAVEASGASWMAWLAEQLSHELARNLHGFDASISPAVDGEPVVWFHTNEPTTMMNRHLRAFVRLAKELDPSIEGGRVMVDPNREGHGIHVVVLQRHDDDRPDTLTDRRLA